MKANEIIEKWNELFQQLITKNRLRAVALYPKMKEALPTMRLVDAKKHICANKNGVQMIRFRLEVQLTNENGLVEVVNFMKFEKRQNGKILAYFWNVDGKYINEEKVEATLFEDKFSLHEQAAFFFKKLFNDLDVESFAGELAEARRQLRAIQKFENEMETFLKSANY